MYGYNDPIKTKEVYMKAFTTKIPDDQNELIKAEAERLGMSRQKYLEKKVIESHVIRLAKRVVNS